MKVAVVSWGTRGDLQPYLALAQGLLRAGHEVRLGMPKNLAMWSIAQEIGVPSTEIGDPIESHQVAATTARAARYPDAVRQLRVFFDELLVPGLERAFGACVELGRWADVIVAHALQPAGRMAAEALDARLVTGTIVPTMLPMGGPFVRGLFRLGTLLANAAWAPGINTVRRRVGLRPLRDLVGDGLFSPDLNLVAVSPLVQSAAAAWWPRHRTTGFWHLRRPAWAPPAPLVDFLEQGEERPVYVGFGSMSSRDPARLGRIVVDAIRRAGVRAILEMPIEEELPPTVLRAEMVPHEWLLDHVAAAVHHGGAGTSAATFRAGIPSVVVPHWIDQHYWAARARALGVAGRAIRPRDLSAGRLAREIRRTLDDVARRDRAASLGVALREEDGVARAIAYIEAYASIPAKTGQLSPVFQEVRA